MNVKHILIAFLISTVPIVAFAGSGDSPVSQGLGWIINQMYGATGIAIATIAVMGTGLLCLGRLVEWKWFLYTVGGIAIIFGADAIVSGIHSLIH